MAGYPGQQQGPPPNPQPAFDPYAMQGGAGGYSMDQWQQLQNWIGQNAQDPSQIYAGLGGIKPGQGNKFDYLLKQIQQYMPQQGGGVPGMPPGPAGGGFPGKPGAPPMPPTPGGVPGMGAQAGGIPGAGGAGYGAPGMGPAMLGAPPMPGAQETAGMPGQPPVPQPTGQYRDMLMRHRANRQMRRANRYDRRNQGQQTQNSRQMIDQAMSGYGQGGPGNAYQNPPGMQMQTTLPNEGGQMPPYGGGFNQRGRGRYGY